MSFCCEDKIHTEEITMGIDVADMKLIFCTQPILLKTTFIYHSSFSSFTQSYCHFCIYYFCVLENGQVCVNVMQTTEFLR